MYGDLFSKPAEYTIDSCALMDIFNDDPSWPSKKVTPGLWGKILEMITNGLIISHIEVFKEIKTDGKKGLELYDWAQKNKQIFQDYHFESEGKILRSMSLKYKNFVNAKISNIHADPWLIAQAKCNKLKIITSEISTTSPNPLKWTIPNVCKDPLFNIKCLTLLDLVKECGWTFK